MLCSNLWDRTNTRWHVLLVINLGFSSVGILYCNTGRNRGILYPGLVMRPEHLYSGLLGPAIKHTRSSSSLSSLSRLMTAWSAPCLVSLDDATSLSPARESAMASLRSSSSLLMFAAPVLQSSLSVVKSAVTLKNNLADRPHRKIVLVLIT